MPPKPGMLRVGAGTGSSIELEVWALSAAAFGKFVAAIPPPLSIGTIRLADGRGVKVLLSKPPMSTAPARFPRSAAGARSWRKPRRGDCSPRHCERSEAIHCCNKAGLLRRFAPRNDGMTITDAAVRADYADTA
jgi:hypothetical protein